jgi:XTP/dITP diphosphohydrolase
MLKLLIATRNPGKFKEFMAGLADADIQLQTLDDVGISEDAPEEEPTFAANALQKAHFYAKLSGLPTLADDAGLEIDYLNGEPGVRTRRWAGYRMTDEELIDMVQERMKGVPLDQCGCQFRTVIAVVAGDRELTVEGSIRGEIRLPPHPKRDAGYPFRSVVFLPELGKYYVELNEAEHEQYNHRRKALQQLRAQLNTIL